MRPLPRILMRRFFDPPEQSPISHPWPFVPPLAIYDSFSQTQSANSTSSDCPIDLTDQKKSLSTPEDGKISPVTRENHQLANQVMDIFDSETSICPEELSDDVEFAKIGVDSLLSLVLVEKFAMILHMDIRASVF